MRKIQVIIIDDERAAREEIKRLIKVYPEFEIVGEAANADEARVLIVSKKPDLLFLDIQMPEKSGFELLESLQEIPLVIFVTAFDQYAVKAFEVSALDYLMKPVREERFVKAIEQIRLKTGLLNEKRIFIKDRQQYHFVSWSKVYLIQSMDNYARLYYESKNVFLKASLNQLEKTLDEHVFFRINRAQIINLNYIDKLSILPGGKIKITLKNGEACEVSDRRSVIFKKLHI